MTGDPKRMGHFGLDWDKEALREFPFDKFKFPACSTCNGLFSDIENSAKYALQKVLSKEELETQDAVILLDWLDKIRIGLWLAEYMLSKNRLGIKPRFHIETRVRRKDRILAIYRTNSEAKELHFLGTSLHMFQYFPCCFTLGVNGVFILNLSSDFLVSRRLGYPYADGWKWAKDEQQSRFYLRAGTRESTSRLFRHLIPPNLLIAQPIFSDYLNDKTAVFYDNSFIRERSLDFDAGLGSLYIERPLTDPKYERWDFYEKMAYQTLSLQNQVAEEQFEWVQNPDDAKSATEQLKRAVEINEIVKGKFAEGWQKKAQDRLIGF